MVEKFQDKRLFDNIRITKIKSILMPGTKAVIVAHKSPDGDSVGSSVGLYHYLLKLGIDVTICHPDPQPYFLDWIVGSEKIIAFDRNPEDVEKAIEEASVIFCLDFNTLSRTGKMEEILRKAQALKIMIDHHLYPEVAEFDFVFSDSNSCSTAQLVFDFIASMGDTSILDRRIGEPLYCGIMTDTGSFRFPSVSPHTHEVIYVLMKHGVLPYKIHEAVYDTNTFDKLKLQSYAIVEKTEIIPRFATAIISLTKDELKRYNYVKGDTEGLVNIGLSINGIKKSIFLMENGGIIKISFRSKGEDNPVNIMASTYFQGGGHLNASGGKWEGTMEEAIAKIKEVLPEFE